MRTLRLGHALEALHASLTNGPGRRVCLWTQGCSLRCTANCLNPHLLSARGGRDYPVAEVSARVRELIAREPLTEGVTVLGGEPFDQAAALTELLADLRRAGLSVMVYTGHVYEDLVARRDAVTRSLLDTIDVLVDGPYLEGQYSGDLAWRGSRNQRILCLSGRYSPQELDAAHSVQRKAFSIHVQASGVVSASGVQERRQAARIEARLRGEDTTGEPTATGS